jgi:hypothetical protein
LYFLHVSKGVQSRKTHTTYLVGSHKPVAQLPNRFTFPSR